MDMGKPHPAPYRHAAQRLGVDPKQSLVLEDAPAGVTSAHRAGSRVIGVTATSPVDTLSEADVVIERLTDLEVTPTQAGLLWVTTSGLR